MIVRNRKHLILVISSIAIFAIGCTKMHINPITSLGGIHGSRTKYSHPETKDYLFTIEVPNKSGTLLWSATTTEPITFLIIPGKPYTTISWRASEARVNSHKPFEISLFLASSGPDPILVKVPTYRERFMFGLGPIIHF